MELSEFVDTPIGALIPDARGFDLAPPLRVGRAVDPSCTHFRIGSQLASPPTAVGRPVTPRVRVLRCPCGARRTIVAFVADPSIAREVLDALGLAAEPATFAPARAPPQTKFGWDDSA